MPNLTSARGKEEKQRLESWWERWLSTRESPSPDYAARDLLYDRYRGYVVRSVNAVVPNIPRLVEYDDLLTAGAIALVQALNRFDPSRGVQFPGYAITLIRGAAMEEMRADDWIPRSVRFKERKLLEAEARLLSRMEPVTQASLARELGVTETELSDNYRPIPVVLSLEAELMTVEDENPVYRYESVECPRELPAVVTEQGEEASLLRACISYLQANERLVMERYYYGGLTLKRVAAEMGLSEGRAHQLHITGLRRLEGFVAV